VVLVAGGLRLQHNFARSRASSTADRLRSRRLLTPFERNCTTPCAS
jgi:hypothetical protein